MTNEKENVLSKLETLIKLLRETRLINLNMESIIAELEDIKCEIQGRKK